MNASSLRLARQAVKRLVRTLVPAAQYVRLANGSRFIVTQDMAWAFPGGRYYEKNVEHWLIRMIEWLPDPVFYDVGANIGYYSLLLSARARQVYAFEPSLRTRRWLWLNLRLNRVRNIQILDYALSDTAGRAQLILYNCTGNNSLFVRSVPKEHELKRVGTESITLIELDRLRRERHLLAPSLIKMDVEGGELRALHGALGTIREAQPILLFEYSEATAKDAGYPREELLNVLAPLAYRCLGLAADPNDLQSYELTQGKAVVDIDNVLAIPAGRVKNFEGSFKINRA